MAKFAWAYVNCSGSGTADGASAGPTGSLQFISGSGGHTTGSAKLVFYTGSSGGYTANSLVLSGNFHVSGTISARVFLTLATVTTMFTCAPVVWLSAQLLET